MTEIKKEESPTPPKPGGAKLPETPEAPGTPKLPGGEKTPKEQEIETLHRQKEHQRVKREEAEKAKAVAEEKARKATEELERLKKANETSTPSDKELAEKYPDWEFKEPEEKERIKQDIVREKRLRRLEETTAWDNDFKSLIRKPEFVALKEREDEFKAFAYKYPKTVDLETLAKSFLFEQKPAEPETPAPPETPARPGLETPSGGPTEPPTTGISKADAKRLREENPKKYAEMVKKGELREIEE